MNVAKLAIENRTVTYTITAVIVIGGLLAFLNMDRLSMPAFTIKRALVATPYPGASAQEVEQEVSDPLEEAAQELGSIKTIQSRSTPGQSILEIELKSTTTGKQVDQAFDDLREKVRDAQLQLPPGAGPSFVQDDFGDVYGIFMAISGEGYTKSELETHAETLKREIEQVDDVASVKLFANRDEVIYVEPNRDRLANLGITTDRIAGKLRAQNLVVNAGHLRTDGERVAVRPTGSSRSLEDLRSIMITSRNGQQITLEDVATIRKGYADPPQALFRYDTQPAVGLAISVTDDGNVVTMGQAVKDRLKEMKSSRPVGIEYNYVNYQPKNVTESVRSFVWNLVTAVAIVVLLLLLTMGWQSGLLIGTVLTVTILGTFIMMYVTDIVLHRVSLGALIIALGMLVDNGVVVLDGMLTRMEEGMDRVRAASSIVQQTALPLLGATVVAILGFAAIGTSADTTGEFLGSIFYVILYSLTLSWILGITLTPLLGVDFLKEPASEEDAGAHSGPFYQAYRRLLQGAVHYRWSSAGLTVVLLLLALWGSGYMKERFFPGSTRPQFMVDVRMPQGTQIEETKEVVKKAESYVLRQEEVTHVSSVIGRGAPRFKLTYTPAKPNPAYAQLIVDVNDWRAIDSLKHSIDARLSSMIPAATVYAFPFVYGNVGGKKRIRARISGPNPDTLRALGRRVQTIFRRHDRAKAVWTDWSNRVKVVRPHVAEDAASAGGITRPAIAQAIRRTFDGRRVGIYRKNDELIPIQMRAPEADRREASNLKNVQVWSPTAKTHMPIRQVVSDFTVDFQNNIIRRYNRKRTLSVYTDPTTGTASSLLQDVRPAVEAMSLPRGYEIEWGGQYENSKEARSSLLSGLPLFLVMMFIITVALFNALRQPIIIWLTVPLALIGVVIGLLSMNAAFGFMSLLGFLSLSGMLIKNSVVLIDEIEVLKDDHSLYRALINASVRRLRPVMMASFTTALGMIPLFTNALFSAMAITITFGLLFATVLTMVVVPVFYAILFRAPRAQPSP
ncbi:MAG: efflux RND transporter permease subunit [Candidatus Bipolaricaulia bacterium]